MARSFRSLDSASFPVAPFEISCCFSAALRGILKAPTQDTQCPVIMFSYSSMKINNGFYVHKFDWVCKFHTWPRIRIAAYFSSSVSGSRTDAFAVASKMFLTPLIESPSLWDLHTKRSLKEADLDIWQATQLILLDELDSSIMKK